MAGSVLQSSAFKLGASIKWACPPTAVLFDLDGTLADTAGDLGGALNQLRVARGLDPLPLDVLRPYASAGARGLIGVGLDIHPGHPEFDTLRAAFLAHYDQCLAETTVLFEGVAAMLDEIDSGMDVDGVRTIVEQVQRLRAQAVAFEGTRQARGAVAAPHGIRLGVGALHRDHRDRDGLRERQ